MNVVGQRGVGGWLPAQSGSKAREKEGTGEAHLDNGHKYGTAASPCFLKHRDKEVLKLASENYLCVPRKQLPWN